MQNSRDSSVWRTLAIAFGDGLAFGVGVTLTRGAARLAANRAALTPEQPAQKAWNHEIEQRTPVAADPTRPQGVQSAALELPSIDRRFQETSQRIDRRLVALESKLQREFDSLDAQDHELAEGVEARLDSIRREIAEAVAAQRQSIDADMRALRAQMTTVHREFAETLSRLLEEQIGTSVATRVQTSETELRETVRQHVEAQNVQAQNVEARLDVLRREIGQAEAAQRQNLDADVRELRAEVTTVHREFAEAWPRLMEEQIGESVEARMQSLEGDLRHRVREDVDHRIDAVRREIGEAEAQSTEANMRGLRAEITTLRQELAETLPVLVEEQAGKSVEARMQSLEAGLRHSVCEDMDHRIDAVRREIGEAEAARAQSTEATMRGMRAEITTLHQELAGTLPALVEEQTGKSVEACIKSLEAGLRHSVCEDVDHRIDAVRREIGEAEAARAQSIDVEIRELRTQTRAQTTVHQEFVEAVPRLLEEQIGAHVRESIDTRIDAVRREIGEAHAAQRQSIDADMGVLRAQMTTVQREFAETLSRLVEEQISQGVAARVQALEANLRNTVREEARAVAQQFDRGPQVAEVRELLTTQERTVRNLMMTLGQSCLQAVETIPPEPAAPEPPAHPPAVTENLAGNTAENSAEAVVDTDLPGFAQTRPRKPLWRVPIVPSFLAATGGLLLLHYL